MKRTNIALDLFFPCREFGLIVSRRRFADRFVSSIYFIMHRLSTFAYLIAICASNRILVCLLSEFLRFIASVVKAKFVVALLLIARKAFPAIPEYVFAGSSRKWDTTAKIDTNVTGKRVSCYRLAVSTHPRSRAIVRRGRKLND